MTTNWLEKEEEYRKLNEELQRQNKILMEEFDDVLKKQANRLLESQTTFTLQQNRCSFVQGKGKFFDESAKENYETSSGKERIDVPESVDQMGVKGMSSYYRAKIRAMQNDQEKLQADLKNKCEELKRAQNENGKLENEKERWFQAYNTNKLAIGKLENQISALNSRCQSKEAENATLRKEMEQIKKEHKQANLHISGGEVRLNRALEENDKMKSELKTIKQEEKQTKELHKKEVDELTKRLQHIEKHKNELLAAYKKQLQLIDNLKKQKMCIEGLNISEICENEYMKILSWKIE